MPRANRYVLPGLIYHLTHRCHDRQFLLKFARDRNSYRKRLRHALALCQVSLLTYNITSNHVHLIVSSDDPGEVARLMQRAAGELARDHNRRKARSGAFWEGRYHATMVDSRNHLWECLKYVELNMVRSGVAVHPRDWQWSGYGELMGSKRRNRLLDMDRLLHLLDVASIEDFRRHFDQALVEAILKDQCKRDMKWTESLAVGSKGFVEEVQARIPKRRETHFVETDGSWILREAGNSYGAKSGSQNEPIAYRSGVFFE